MGLRSVAKDLGLDWTSKVPTDATAATCVCKRRGLGNIRHVATADLLMHGKRRTNEFELHKVAGKENLSDILTKHTDRATLEKHLMSMGLRQEYGRAQSAPALEHSISFIFPCVAFRKAHLQMRRSTP